MGMIDNKEFVKLALDTYHGRPVKYSVDESLDVLRRALVEANGGSTVLDYKAIRDGKCGAVFSLIETILSRTVSEGLQGDEYFTALAQYFDTAAGDKNLFEVEDNIIYVVADSAKGSQGVRRQRLGGVSQATIPTSFKSVRLYESVGRVLSGQVDFNTFIARVAVSFRQKLLDDMYALWSNVTATQLGGTAYFPAAGSYDEDTLLDVISHVEAAAGGKTATIIGTKKALRKIYPSIAGETCKTDVYNNGYCGRFYGANVVATPQRHKVGSTEFVFDDDTLTVIAGDDKPIKIVREGQPTVVVGDITTNRDYTQEYFYGEMYGMGLILAGGNAGIGRYKITG